MKSFLVALLTILIFILFVVLAVLLLIPESQKDDENAKRISKIQYSKTLRTQTEENTCKEIERIGDGLCHAYLNHADCDYDYGDCCQPSNKSIGSMGGLRIVCHKVWFSSNNQTKYIIYLEHNDKMIPAFARGTAMSHTRLITWRVCLDIMDERDSPFE